MTDTTVTVQVKAKIDQFRQQMDKAKQKVTSFSRGAKRDTTDAEKSVTRFGERFKKIFSSQTGKNFGFLASLNPQIGKIQKGIEGIGNSMSKSGAKGKMAMAGGVAAIGMMVGGIIADAIKRITQFYKKLGMMADPIGMEKLLSRLQVQMDKMESAWGNVLYPVIEGVITGVGYIVEGMTFIFEKLAQISGFLQGMYGYTVRTNESLRDTADAIEEATESAQEGLAGFDKLNTLGSLSVAGLEESAKVQEMMQEANELGLELSDRMGWLFKFNLINLGKMAWDKIRWFGVSAFETWKTFNINLWNGIKTVGETIWNGLAYAFNTIMSPIKDFLEGLLETVEKIVSVASSVSGGGILDSITSTVGNVWGTLTGHAKGGVIEPNDPHAVIVGDNTREREVISPLSTMKQAFKEALAESSSYGGKDTTINLTLDGRVIARAVYDPLKQEARRRGATGTF